MRLQKINRMAYVVFEEEKEIVPAIDRAIKNKATAVIMIRVNVADSAKYYKWQLKGIITFDSTRKCYRIMSIDAKHINSFTAKEVLRVYIRQTRRAA